ncbi:SMI1/KNR4 family protein [Spirillospora sp. CA-253888]
MSPSAEQVARTWQTIETWLARHAPRSRLRLPGPASEDRIRATETELDLTMPEDLRAFYLLRNGTGPVSDFDWAEDIDAPDPSGYLFPAERGIAPLEKLPQWFHGPVAAERIHGEPQRRYLAFTASDPDGFYGEFVDCTPGVDHGTVGSYAEADVARPGLWPSFAAYLVEMAEALTGLRQVNGDVPGVLPDGTLMWSNVDSPAEPGWTPIRP